VTTLFLADTSAYTIARKMPAAETRLRQLATDAVLATFVTVDLELSYSARDPREHQGISACVASWYSSRAPARSPTVRARSRPFSPPEANTVPLA